MSGEQAEERRATEGRPRAEKIASEIFEKVFGAPVVKARNGDDADAAESASVLTKVIRHMYIEQMSDIIERELAECSRLASRVEELEKCLREIYVVLDGPLSASDKVYCLKLLNRALEVRKG